MTSPRWRTAYDESLDVVEAGFAAGRAALALRCPRRAPDGRQCTADAEPAHVHRFVLEELPGGFVPVDEEVAW